MSSLSHSGRAGHIIPPEPPTEVSGRRLELALDACNPGRIHTLHQRQRGGQLSAETLAQVLLCELQRVHGLLSGEMAYDYDTQEWIEEGGAA